jgi:hypothetical protein
MLGGMRGPRRRTSRHRRGLAVGLSSTALAAGVWLAAPSTAEAAVEGKRGLEIEGARDRRGFYAGVGAGFGGTFFWYDDFIPAMRMDLALGGGITKRFTLGADIHVTPYLQRDVGVAFGADIEGTGYLWRGLYLRAGLGASAVPKRSATMMDDDTKGLTAGLGGAFGVGYEFWLNATAALGAGITYDARFIPGDSWPRQALLIGLRFSWY